jgi:hypothetical protein
VENTPDSESILSSENIIVDNKLNTEWNSFKSEPLKSNQNLETFFLAEHFKNHCKSEKIRKTHFEVGI